MPQPQSNREARLRSSGRRRRLGAAVGNVGCAILATLLVLFLAGVALLPLAGLLWVIRHW